MPTTQPNVIYILSDEHRGQAMSHMGDPNVETPVMDRLARQGVSFSRAYANCPICTPSRGTLFSGRHAHCGPVSGFFDVFKATAPSTATHLRDAGYHSAYFGKWHCGVVRDQVPRIVREHPETYPRGTRNRTPEYYRGGFQDWFGFECLNQPFTSSIYEGDAVEPTLLDGYQTDALTSRAIDYLRDYDRDEPLLMVLSVEPPHFPLQVPERWKRFDPQALEVRPNFVENPCPAGGLPTPTPWTFDEQDIDTRRYLALYYAMIENLDWNIGRLLAAMEGLPRFAGANTLVVYVADHGDFMGSHGLYDRKEHPHEESTRIPALFHWPEHIPPQGVTEGLFGLVDVLATTCGLLGLEIPPWNQGCDFSPLLVDRLQPDGEPFAGPEEQLLEMVNNPRWNLDFMDWRGLVTQRFKYAFYETGVELLFDLETDPYEMRNLAQEAPELCRQIRRKLLALLEETREPYFDVLIEHGVPCPPHVISVADDEYRILGMM
jgi:arylsulfatase A-like enzyme